MAGRSRRHFEVLSQVSQRFSRRQAILGAWVLGSASVLSAKNIVEKWNEFWGRLVPVDPASPLVELNSGYVLRAGMRCGGPGGRHDGTFVEDYVYEGGRGLLDPLNGRMGVTPERASGIFHYIVSATFPWIPRIFRGPPHPSFILHPNGPGIGLTSLASRFC